MPNRDERYPVDIPGASAKSYFLASRAVMESVLRPFGLGSSQWYVLARLDEATTVSQRDLAYEMGVERPTLSAIVTTLVRKGLIEQVRDDDDQRHKVLCITAAGSALWQTLPNPMALIADVAFSGVDPADIATMNHVLNQATSRLMTYKKESTS